MSRRRVALFVALALTSCGGGTPTPGKGGGGGRTFDAEGEGGKTEDGGPAPSVPPVPDLAEATAALTPARKQLAETASLVVDRIRELEIQRDVTCWTSFRQLDNFIATKSYSNFATLTKIVAAKALVHGVWAEASKQGGAVLSADDIEKASKVEAALPPTQPPGLDQLAVDLGQQQFKDYRTTSEHWRVVLSIAQDELLSSSPQVKPLSPEAADELALVATRLSLALLTESGEVATLARAPLIEIDHVKSAFTQVKERYGIADVMPAGSLDVAGARPALLAITRRLIDAKIEALRRFNKAGDALAPELNKISKLEVTDDGAAELRSKLDHFAEFMARGYEPMRADNYLADGNFADKPLEGKPYIDAEYVENATVQLFPYVMMPNGDVRMRFEARPGTLIDEPIEPQDVTLLDHQMNAVRDTAIHWVVLQDVWGKEPFAMDPFAAEYLSELVSIVGTFWMRRAQTLARANNREQLDGASFAGVEDNRFAMVMPKDDAPHPSWTPAKQKAKATLLRRYGKALFADVSAAWGLPQEVTVAGYGTVGAHSGAQPVGAHSGAQSAGAHSGKQPAGAHSGADPQKPAGAHSGADAQKPAGAHSGADAQQKPAGAHSGADAQKKPAGAHSGADAQKKPAGAHSGADPQKPAGAHSGKDAQQPAGAHSGKDGQKPSAHADTRPAGAHSGAAPRVGDLGFDIQKVMGAGIAVGDIDADGDSDLFFSGEGLGRLYLNDDEGGTRKLVDVSAAWGVPADLVDSHHAMFLDHDGDNDLDLLIVRGRSPSLLLDNQDGKLVDVTAKRNLVTGVGAHVASAFDYDEDGDVDVHIGYYGSAACNRGECNGRNLPSVDGRNGSPNQLFRNDGEQYTEVAAAARVADEG
ncbi:MAG TPA: hypothetical protein VG755_25890, partial [Nannocystaceae bacterium]|nr:hypothetical protein [Nannocystaceae bacterium]